MSNFQIRADQKMNSQQHESIIEQLTRIADALEAVALLTPHKATQTPTTTVVASPYVSPDVPPGYDTVVGYFSNTLPTAFDLLEDPISDTQRDGFWLAHQASKRGLAIVKVKAPEAFAAYGIEEVNAYPISLLAERIYA